MTSTFCVMPWMHLDILPSGSSMICCGAYNTIKVGDEEASLYRHTIGDIWRSDHVRDVRRAMLAGQWHADCEGCMRQEEKNLPSLREQYNNSYLGTTPEEQAVKLEHCRSVAEETEFGLDGQPESLQLTVGNLCNLKCRMCHGRFSSQIERDPVHGLWASLPYKDVTTQWRNETIDIAPRPALGAKYDGFYAPEFIGRESVRWSEPVARIDLPVLQDGICGLSLRLSETMPESQRLRLAINGRVLCDEVIGKGSWERCYDFDEIAVGSELRIDLEASGIRIEGDDRELGVPIANLQLRRRMQDTDRGDDVLFSRVNGRRTWYEDADFIMDEIFPDRDKVRIIGIVGGEPFISPTLMNVFRRLVDDGMASNIILRLTTNATRLTDEWIELLREFKSLLIGISIDGIGYSYEYIRAPAKWKTLEKNIAKLLELDNAFVAASPTIQAYNALEVVEMYRYFVTTWIQPPAFLNVLSYPDYLSLRVLPPKARRIAASRLRAYAEKDCPSDLIPGAMQLAAALDGFGDEFDHTVMRQFMLFTNDLDKSRNQDFRQTYPELYELIVDAGFDWTDETRYA